MNVRQVTVARGARSFLCLWAAMTLPCAARAQATASGPPRPIQDNSFLLEEAYNQETRVVQHISAMMYQPSSRDWAYSFTQEWPVMGQRHQFSYTVPIASAETGVGGRSTGIGDALLNYRYQLAGSGDTRIAFAPRISLLLPTGDEQKGFGRGKAGMQLNFPLSATLGPRFVTHLNAGVTVTPGVSAGTGSVTLKDFAAGESLIWLAHPNFNVMTEALWSRTAFAVPGGSSSSESFILAPGVRGAFNFASGLQIVPGIAIPIEMRGTRTTSMFSYLSFEHPF